MTFFKLPKACRTTANSGCLHNQFTPLFFNSSGFKSTWQTRFFFKYHYAAPAITEINAGILFYHNKCKFTILFKMRFFL